VADSAIKKFFKVSCVGCLGLVFLGIAIVVIFGWISGRSAEFIDDRASYPADRLNTSAPLVEAEKTSSEDPDDGVAVNRVRVLVSGVEKATVRPCDEGEDLSVEATYNKKRVAFSESLEHEQDGSWTYTVEMTGSGGQLTRMIQRLFSGQGTELEMCLPGDALIALEAEANGTGFDAELGGLWLSSVDLQADKGGVIVGFGAPLREPVESLTVGVNMGGIVLQGVGNASPAFLDVNYQFGGGLLDLSGEWRTNVQIDLDGRAGGVTVIVPKSVLVEGVPDMVPGSGGNPETTPTLFFAPGTNFDEVTVQRR
jgi:hypothetical protein